MIIFKKKQNKFDQKEYDILFQNIENDLRELGFGDVTVNKKMKQLNKVLYDILLKLESNKSDINIFKLDHKLVIKYFSKFKHSKDQEYIIFETYFLNFYNFCFELSLDNMIRNAIKFRN